MEELLFSEGACTITLLNISPHQPNQHSLLAETFLRKKYLISRNHTKIAISGQCLSFLKIHENAFLMFLGQIKREYQKVSLKAVPYIPF